MSLVPTNQELKNILGNKRFEILHLFSSDQQGTCLNCDYYVWKCWLCDHCKYYCRWNEKQSEMVDCEKKDLKTQDSKKQKTD
jgi:hypothetical protein